MEQEQIRYNSDGEKLQYVGNSLWVPEGFEFVQKDKLKEEVIRPEIPVVGTALSIIVAISTNLILALLLNKYLIGITMLTLFGILMFVCIYINLKSIMIFAILIYQRLAPNEIRNRCLFIPSCSNYTILVLKKYGILIGTIKAVDRFRRCRPPNGGEDYP